MNFFTDMFRKIGDFVRGPEEDAYDEYDDELEEIERDNISSISERSEVRSRDISNMIVPSKEPQKADIVNINEKKNEEITFFKPVFSSDAKEVLMSLKEGKLGIVRLDSLNEDDRKEVFENIKGACMITEGNIKKLDEYIYMVVPSNTNLILENGKISKQSDSPNPFEIRIFEPDKYNDVMTIVDYFKTYKPIILKLGNLEENFKTRIFEFVNGAVYTLEGKSKLLMDDILLLSPKNIKVSSFPIVKATTSEENVKTEKVSNIIFKL